MSGEWTQADVDRINARRGRPADQPAAITEPSKRPKFGNKKTLCDGILFDSGHEADRYRYLKALSNLGQIRDLELQPQFGIFACVLASGLGIEVASFKADFRYFDVAEDRIRVEDAKSDGTKGETAYRLRKKLVEACHGVIVEEV